MNMTEKIFKLIAMAGELIPAVTRMLRSSGRKYYAVAVYREGTGESLLTSAIHRTLAEAEAHAEEIGRGRSFRVAGIVSFRSDVEL